MVHQQVLVAVSGATTWVWTRTSSLVSSRHATMVRARPFFALRLHHPSGVVVTIYTRRGGRCSHKIPACTNRVFGILAVSVHVARWRRRDDGGSHVYTWTPLTVATRRLVSCHAITAATATATATAVVAGSRIR